MTEVEIDERVRDILAETLDVDAALVTADADLLEDLGGDSLMMLEVLARLDGEFAINIEQAQLARMITRRAVTRIVVETLAVAA